MKTREPNDIWRLLIFLAITTSGIMIVWLIDNVKVWYPYYLLLGG